MNRFMAILALSAVLAGAILAQSVSAEKQISDLDEKHRQSALRGDPSFEEQYTTADYMSVTSSGAVHTREQAVALVRSGDVKLSALDIKDEVVRIYEGTAIVTGIVDVRGTLKGQPFQDRARYMRVWVKQNGNWKLASFQETPMKQPAS